MDKQLAEFVGILLGDGSIGVYDCMANGKSKKYYRIKITLNSDDDAEYAEYVRLLIEKLFGAKPILKKRLHERALDIFIFNRKIIRNVLALGMKKAPKWNRATVPKRFLTSKLASSLLRGYFDTDGCITIANNNGIRYPRIEMKICPSPMQKQLITALAKLGFEPRVYTIGKGKVRVVLPGLKNLKKWRMKIGFSNKKNISRADSFIERKK